MLVDACAPGYVGPRVEGTDHDGESGSRSLYLVEDVSRLEGALGDTTGADGPAKERLERLFRSLQANSSVEFRNYTTGYGRVGTSFQSKMRAGRLEITDADGGALRAAAASVGPHLLEGRLGVAPSAPAPQPSLPPVLKRVVVGALLAGLGVAWAATAAGPMSLVGGGQLAALVGTMAGLSSRPEADAMVGEVPRDQEAFRIRRQAGFWKGALLGAGAVGALLAGSYLGPAGVALAAGASALSASLLG